MSIRVSMMRPFFVPRRCSCPAEGLYAQRVPLRRYLPAIAPSCNSARLLPVQGGGRPAHPVFRYELFL